MIKLQVAAKWPNNEHSTVRSLFIIMRFLESRNQFETKRNIKEHYHDPPFMDFQLRYEC